MDGLALGVVEAVVGLDVGQHGEAPVADDGEGQGDDEADPDADGEELAAVPGGAELGALDVEDLQLEAGEGDGELVLVVVGGGGVGGVGEGGEGAGGVAAEAETERGVDPVAVGGGGLREEHGCDVDDFVTNTTQRCIFSVCSIKLVA